MVFQLMLCASLALAADQLAKALVARRLAAGQTGFIGSCLQIRHVIRTGVRDPHWAIVRLVGSPRRHPPCHTVWIVLPTSRCTSRTRRGFRRRQRQPLRSAALL